MNRKPAEPSEAGRGRFPKSAHLLRTSDFRKVYDAGRRRNIDWLLAFCLYTGAAASRVGLTVPRALGGSVQRNRIKRRVREAVRMSLSELGPGWDVVLHPRAAALTLEFDALRQTVAKLFRECASGALAGGAKRGDSGAANRRA